MTGEDGTLIVGVSMMEGADSVGEERGGLSTVFSDG